MPSTANVQQRPRSGTNGSRAHPAVRSELRRLEQLFDEQRWCDRRAYERTRKRARARASQVLAAGDASREEHRAALLAAAAELLGGMRGELAGAPRRYAGLVERALEVTGLPAVALAPSS